MEIRSTISVKPDKFRLLNLLEEIAEGKICIPVFQRDFVWKKDQMKNLFDSISKGYPIGSLLFWKPDKVYQSLNKIGPYHVQHKSNYYVLDGFQRITTLFGVLSNPKVYGKSEHDIKDYLIYYNLETKEFDFLKSRRSPNISQISLYKIVDTFEYLDFIQEIKSSKLSSSEQNKLINSAKEINKIFLDYHIPFVEINGGDIKSAVDIFSRTNSTGTEISEDFMLSALTYNALTGFLLSESITEFLNSLNVFNFEDLKRDTILNCISTSRGKIYFDVKIEDLLNLSLEEITNNSYVHILQAIAFLYKRLFILDTRLLPYPSQLIFISEFFRLNATPTAVELDALENWFWVTTYSNYFTLYSLSQQRRAYEVFCSFAEGKHVDGIYLVDEDTVFSTAKYPDRLNFTGVRPKALQLFYLKSIVGPAELEDRESLKEIFVTSKKDRTPANIIFRLSSEFDQDVSKKPLDEFLENSSDGVLERHFITREMVVLFKEEKFDQFISQREDYIKQLEAQFVEALNIRYSEQ